MKTGILALSLLLGAAPLVAAQYGEDCDENPAPPNSALNTPGVAPLSVATNLRTYTVEPLHRGRKPWPTARPKGNARPTALPYDGETAYGYGTGNEASGDYPVNDIGADIGGDQPASSGYGQGNDNLLGGGWTQAGGGYDQPTPAAGGYQTGWGYSAPATEAREISDVSSASIGSETIATEAVAFSASTSQPVSTRATGGYASPTAEGSVDEGGHATSTATCSASEAATDYSSSSIEAQGLSTSQTAAVSETGVTGAYSVPTVQDYSSPSLEAAGEDAALSSGIIAGSASYTSLGAATSATEAIFGSSSSSGMASSSTASATGVASFSVPSVQAVTISSASYSPTSTGTSFSVLAESEGHTTASSASVAIAQFTTSSVPGGYSVASESSVSAASTQSTSSSTASRQYTSNSTASRSVEAASGGGSSFATLPVSAASNSTGNHQVASAVSPAAYASTTNTTVASSLTMTRTVYLSSQSFLAATAAATSAGYTFTTRRPHGKGGPKQICSCWNEY